MFSASTKTWAYKALLALVALTLAALLTGCGLATDSENVGEVSQAVCTGITASVNTTSPKPAGTQITVTATAATCAGGETAEYRFLWFQDGTSNYGFIRDYAPGLSAVWNTTGFASGKYQIVAYARHVGYPYSYESYAYVPNGFVIGNSCNVMNSFTTSPTSPQGVGTQVSLTASATCTGGTAQYRFAYLAPGASSYVDVGPFGAATQNWNTTGLPPGRYSLIAYARAAGSQSSQESYLYNSYSLGAVCTGASFSASPPSPQAIGTNITLTGTASCATPEFRFSYRLNGNSTWITIGSGGDSTSPQTWSTTGLASGLYNLLVEARSVGNVGPFESANTMNFAVGSTCSSVTESASPASTSAVGTQVTLTGNASCSGGATAEYRYKYQTGGGAYALLRDYGPAAFVWDTTLFASGIYSILVEARAAGSAGQPESAFAFGYTLSAAYGTQVNSGGGSHHACARVSNGMVRCWGQNDFGQLGNGTVSASSSSPVTVSGLTNVLQVATGASHSCAVLTDNTVRCWGLNSTGQLGNGNTTSSSIPVVATGLANVTALSLGDYHSCGLLSTGGISCWGKNNSGQTGTTPVGASYQVVPTATAITSGATAVSAGGFHTCAIVGGGLKCWGDNTSGQLGTAGVPAQNSVTPLDVPGLTSGVTSVSSGDLHVCAVASGAVQCWGDNQFGQLGNGASSLTPTTSPGGVAGLAGVVEVASGLVFSCARLSDQTIKCWGRNTEGEIGDGTTADKFSPTSVSGISTATSLTAGGVSACSILANNQTRCWGYGGFGGLGNGSTSDALTPVVVVYP